MYIIMLLITDIYHTITCLIPFICSYIYLNKVSYYPGKTWVPRYGIRVKHVL